MEKKSKKEVLIEGDLAADLQDWIIYACRVARRLGARPIPEDVFAGLLPNLCHASKCSLRFGSEKKQARFLSYINDYLKSYWGDEDEEADSN